MLVSATALKLSGILALSYIYAENVTTLRGVFLYKGWLLLTSVQDVASLKAIM